VSQLVPKIKAYIVYLHRTAALLRELNKLHVIHIFFLPIKSNETVIYYRSEDT